MTIFCHSFAEIVEVIGKTLLLLADVKFLDIIYQLLLKAVLVVFHLGYGAESIDDALAYLFYTRLLVGLNFRHKLLDVVDLLGKLALKGCTLLTTEVNKLLKSHLDAIPCNSPLAIGENLQIGLGHHIRHPQQSGENVLWLGYACC